MFPPNMVEFFKVLQIIQAKKVRMPLPLTLSLNLVATTVQAIPTNIN